MATIKRIFVFSTSVLSGIATLFIFLALLTEQWIVSDETSYILTTSGNLKVKYGLFEGTVFTTQPSPQTLVLSMTCLPDKGVCAMLCAQDSDGRQSLLESIYYNHTGEQKNCPSVSSDGRTSLVVPRSTNTENNKYINYGIWVSTIFFLVIAILFGSISTGIAVYNTVSNPIQIYLSIFGLYIYNGIALASSVLAMTLWGVAHLFTTFHNVAIFFTLLDLASSDKKAHLGYSFWILLIPIFLFVGSIGVLFVRNYLISKEPNQKVIQREEPTDSVIYLF